MNNYERNVRGRRLLRFWAGYIVRAIASSIVLWKVRRMRNAGAVVGECLGIARGIMPPASPKVVIGNHVSIHTAKIDVRAPLTIGDYVILGDDSSIITCSHDIDDREWRHREYGLVIEDYVWLATRAMILPSCRRIGRGAVIGAGAVVVKDVPPMAVMSGNPARVIRYRKTVHDELVVESLFGCDRSAYWRARFCS